MSLELSKMTAQAQVAAIYIGYYDRAADPVGSGFWEGIVARPDVSLSQVASAFALESETKDVHSFFENPTLGAATAFISELYLNLFNREPDMGGLNFWSGVLKSAIDGTGTMSVGEIVLEIISGAQDTAMGNDLTTIRNKIDVATAWTDAATVVGVSADNFASSAELRESARAIIDGVTDVASTVDASKEELVEALRDALVDVADNAKTAALTDTAGTTYADVDTAITSNDAAVEAAATTAATTAALTDTAGTTYADVDTAITSNDDAATDANVAGATDFNSLSELVVAYDALANPEGGTFVLTTAANTVVGVSGGDDTITGGDDDIGTANIIVDGSTSDADTLTVTGRAFQNTFTTATDTIVNIETIDVNFDTLTNASFAADGVITATTLDFENVRAGSGASLTVTAVSDGSTLSVADFNTVTATADAGGDMTVNADASTGTITTTVSGDGIAVVNAAAAATVSSTAATGNTTIAAAAATSITATSTSGDIGITGAANATVSATSTSAGDITVDAALADSVTAATTGAGTVVATGEGDTAMSVTARTSTITLSANDTTNNAAVTITGTGAGIETDTSTITSGDDFTLTNNAGVDAVETVNVVAAAAIEAQIQGTTAGATTMTGDSNVTFTGDHALFDDVTVTGGAAIEITAIDLATDVSKVTGIIELSGNAAGGEILSVNDNGTVKLSSTQTSLEINADDDVANTATTYLQGTLNVTVDADQTGTITIDPSAANTDGFDTVNVTATTAVTTGLDLRTASTTAINLSGAVNVAVDSTTTGASLNASGMTGILTATQTSSLLSVTGGSGNDVLTSNDTTATAVVNAGAGNDTLSLTAAFAGTANGGDGADELDLSGALNFSSATISGFETVDVNGNNVTVDESLLNGASLVVQSTGGTAETITLVNILSSTDLSGLAFADSLVSTNIDYSGANRDSSLGAGAATSITGSSATDTIVGGTGADTLLGGAGADSITGGDGADYIDGGAGNDTTLSGGNGADTIFGGAGDDTGVDGGAGDDVIDGGAGADTLNGGADDDTITGGEGADTIDGDAGEDSIILTESSSAADTVVVSVAVGVSSDSGSKSVTGNNNDVGEDTLTGFAFGSDLIKIVATDAVSFVHGTDTEIGTADADAAATGINDDYAITVGLVDLDNDGVYDGVDDVVLTFASPNAALTEARFEAALQYDVVLADGADQTFTSGAQADVIQSGDGNDTIDGGAGADTYKYVDVGDSGLNNAAAAYTGIDTVAVTTGDIFDYTGADIDAVIAAEIAEGSAVDANGGDLLTSLSAAFAANDDGVANIEAAVIAYTGGEQFLVIDIDSSETITDADIAVQLTGTVTGLTLSSGDIFIA